jgi:hypothetical protein
MRMENDSIMISRWWILHQVEKENSRQIIAQLFGFFSYLKAAMNLKLLVIDGKFS